MSTGSCSLLIAARLQRDLAVEDPDLTLNQLLRQGTARVARGQTWAARLGE